MTASPGHILCIDDDEDILQVAKLTLEMIGGFKVSVCRGGKSALEEVRRLQPDLILLDAMMPQMDGSALLKLLRESGFCSDTPVVFMTGRVQPEEVAEFLRQGAVGVISKPFDPMTLSAQVGELWSNLREP